MSFQFTVFQKSFLFLIIFIIMLLFCINPKITPLFLRILALVVERLVSLQSLFRNFKNDQRHGRMHCNQYLH